MNDTKQIPCSCAACAGPGCLCGCQQAAAQAAAPPACTCGPQCPCSPGAPCATS